MFDFYVPLWLLESLDTKKVTENYTYLRHALNKVT